MHTTCPICGAALLVDATTDPDTGVSAYPVGEVLAAHLTEAHPKPEPDIIPLTLGL